MGINYKGGKKESCIGFKKKRKLPFEGQFWGGGDIWKKILFSTRPRVKKSERAAGWAKGKAPALH